MERDDGKSYGGSTLFVDVTLTDVRIVSSAARFWAGEFAGRSHMKIIAKLSDENDLIVAKQELFGAPNASSSTWSIGGTDKALPKNMGILLGYFILANVSGK